MGDPNKDSDIEDRNSLDSSEREEGAYDARSEDCSLATTICWKSKVRT